MTLRTFRPTSSGQRFRIDVVEEVTADRPQEKKLRQRLKRNRGRSHGRVTVRHKGGGSIRYYRRIDYRRDKKDIEGTIRSIEYDPYCGAHIALVCYRDGEYRYILAPLDLKVGSLVLAAEKGSLSVGNALPLKEIPVGTLIHNVEVYPGRGGQLARGAGTAAQVVAKEESNLWVHVRLPSGEIKRIQSRCYATVGQVGNPDHKNIRLGKAGRSRHLGRRPTVRGVAQNPRSHPHGGGEGRSGVGMKSPKSPWGWRTLGKKTRRRMAMNRYVVAPRRKR